MSPDAAKIKLWRERPDLFVRHVFGATPDPWQDDVLRMFPTNQRQAMKASKGPGKSTTLAWLAWNFLVTRPHPNIAATSVSGDNLADGLWKEMAVWRERSPALKDTYEITAERIFHKRFARTWFMTARTWPKAATTEELGNTLAGLHADYIMYLIDEAGSIPVAILAAAEAALSSCIEGHLVIAGNTNSLEGALYQACVRQAYLWNVVPISGDPDDPKRSTRISIDWAKEMIKSYGRDSPFVKVMVLGEWPNASINALISANEVEAAMKRLYRDEDMENQPRILGVDVARGGLAKSVIFPRQGLVAFKSKVMQDATSIQGAAMVSRVWRDWDVNACFVDATGGFGAGWVDQLGVLGRNAIGIQFSQGADDKVRYFNKRAEMYFSLAQWIVNGGALPPDVPELLVELPAMTYTFKGDRLMLEDKGLVETKIGYSPDHSDALALTFAAPVAPRVTGVQIRRPAQRSEEYDPFKRFLAPAH